MVIVISITITNNKLNITLIINIIIKLNIILINNKFNKHNSIIIFILLFIIKINYYNYVLIYQI